VKSKSKKPLFERLGGAEAIALVVEGMYAKIFADPDLSDFFKKTDRERQKHMMRLFLTQATGGPADYAGKGMAAAHKGRGIAAKDFDRVCLHVVTTMKEAGVPQDLIDETTALLGPLKAECTD
jgi:hemoglobin